MRRVRVILHGPLREAYSGPIEIVAETPAQVIEAIGCQIPGLKPDANGHKRIRVKDYPTEKSLHDPLTSDELHIFPQVNGGKNGGFTQILIGGLLIAAAFFMPGALGAAFAAVSSGTAGFASYLTVSLFMAGASMVIGGLVATLLPAPSMDGQKATEASKYLGTPGSTVAIGTPIRVIYGKRRVGFHLISANVNARGYTP